MANLKLEEKVVIAAPVDVVWRFLLDPERVVQCLPGAAYDGKEADNVFLGHIKVKVGPVTTLFAGKATMSEIDEVAHSLRITGEGKDKNGAGTAKMVMLGKVAAVEQGAELTIDAEVDIAGKLVTFGRGLIKSVSAQLFKQFSARAQELLGEEQAEATASDATSSGSRSEPPAAGEAASSATGDQAAEAPASGDRAAEEIGAASEETGAAAADDTSAPARGRDQAAAARPDAAEPDTAKPDAAKPDAAKPDAAPPATAQRPATTTLSKRPPQEESLNALSLVFRAIASSIADFFRRLFGRGKR